ncbi:MAG: hypothetical protein ACI91J_003551, partial [Yoonia sp.]
MKTHYRLTLSLAVLILGLIPAHPGFGAGKNRLEPILASPGKVHLAMDFDEDFTVEKGDQYFLRGQGTT